ncbi:MAG: hypothetical protein IIB63_10290 [Proteobacteria bacterium]|nr:hypothetical protein [Pseudomonadota bacterium]
MLHCNINAEYNPDFAHVKLFLCIAAFPEYVYNILLLLQFILNLQKHSINFSRPHARTGAGGAVAKPGDGVNGLLSALG